MNPRRGPIVAGEKIQFTDRKGKKTAVVADKITYVEIGSEAGERRVGFSAV